MYSAQNTMYSCYPKRGCICHLSREDNVPSHVDQRTPLAKTWKHFISETYLHSMWSANNQLSVTVVNDEILNSSFLKNSPTKIKDLSYTLQEQKCLHNLQQKYSKDYIESMLPDSVWGPAPKMDHMQDWDIVDDPNVKIRNDVNIIKNSNDTYENNSTMESHFMPQVNKTEKMKDNMTDTSGFSDVDLRKHEVDIHKDADVESFHVVSHSDVPATPINFLNFENPISRFSNVCRNVWNNLSRFYCKTVRMSVKRPLYSIKQHHRRKANTIAIGRGRGRAKGQLRRSGVSQTIRRKECIKYKDYEIWLNDLVSKTSNDCLLNSTLDLDNMDIPNPAQVTKQIDSLSISNSPKATTSAKGKPKARKKKKTKVKYVTKVRYIPTSSKINDHCENSNSKIPDAQEDSSQSQALSDYSADVEDEEWIVFEDDDDEKLPETREERGATEYPIGACCVPNSSIRKNNSSYEDSNCEIHDAEKVSFRLRSSSESSTDSEDSNHSSTVSDEQEAMECLKNHNRLTKISEDFNNEKRKNSFQHRRLLSDSSETSDGSNISNSDSFNSFFATEENDDVDGYDEISFHDGDQDDSIIFAEDSKELKAQTKKVSFDSTPVVHVMVTWNYAYRAARRGPWEEIARDNERFRGRINSIAIVLDPILKSTHRSQVWQERFAE